MVSMMLEIADFFFLSMFKQNCSVVLFVNVNDNIYKMFISEKLLSF